MLRNDAQNHSCNRSRRPTSTKAIPHRSKSLQPPGLQAIKIDNLDIDCSVTGESLQTAPLKTRLAYTPLYQLVYLVAIWGQWVKVPILYYLYYFPAARCLSLWPDGHISARVFIQRQSIPACSLPKAAHPRNEQWRSRLMTGHWLDLILVGVSFHPVGRSPVAGWAERSETQQETVLAAMAFGRVSLRSTRPTFPEYWRPTG